MIGRSPTARLTADPPAGPFGAFDLPLPGADVPIRVAHVPFLRCEAGPGILELSGRTAKDFARDPHLLGELVIDADRERFDAIDFRIVDPSSPVVLRWRHRDGRILWIEHRLRPYRNGDGRPVGSEGFLRDVSRQCAAEEMLGRLGRVCSDAFDGIAGIDPVTLRLIQTDPKTRALFGLTEHDAPRHSIDAYLDEDSRRQLLREVEILSAGSVGRSSLNAVTRSGERHLRLRLAASEGQPPAIMVYIEDRSEELRTSAARTRLEIAIESAREGIAVLDSSRSFQFANYEFANIAGCPLSELKGYRPEILEQILPMRDVWTAVAEHGTWRGGIEAVNRRGKRFGLAVSIARIGGGVVAPGFIVLLQDVTAEQEAVAALASSTQARARLGVSLERLGDSPAVADVAGALADSVMALSGVMSVAVVDVAMPDDSAVLATRSADGHAQLGRLLAAPARVRALLELDLSAERTRPTAALIGNAPAARTLVASAPYVSVTPLVREESAIALVCVAGAESIGKAETAIADLTAMAGAAMGEALVAGGRKRRLRQELQDIIVHRRFRPIFQPIIDLRSEATVGWEATTRFADGTPPARRFEEAAETAMTVDLEAVGTRLAISEAQLNQCPGWLSLNVSLTFLASIDRLLNLLPDDRDVVIEIAVSGKLDDAVLAAISRLPDNVRIAVDGASSEFATLRSIAELHPTYIKLPPSLVRGIEQDHVRQSLIAGMQHFAASTASSLIAVGVETEAEFETLAQLGVPFAQGNYLGEPGYFPIPAPGVEEVAA